MTYKSVSERYNTEAFRERTSKPSMVLSLLSLIALGKQATLPKTISTVPKPFVSKIGLVLETPVELGKPTLIRPSLKKVTVEEYSPKEWPGCYVRFSKMPIGAESKDDSDAVKLEDVVYNELDLEKDTITQIHFGLTDGWPSVDVSARRKDGVQFRYHIVRSKVGYFTVLVKGQNLPEEPLIKKIITKLHLPRTVAKGRLKSWGPRPTEGVLPDTNVTVWTPMRLADSDDVPDLGDDGVSGVAFSGDYGYSSYTVSIVKLTSDLEERMDEEAIDRLVHLKYQEDDDGTAVIFGHVQSVKIGNLEFRSVSYLDDSLDGRVDAVVSEGKLYVFSVTVPHGMLESDDVKHFFQSIKIP